MSVGNPPLEVRLPCTTDAGMFSNEVAVQITGPTGNVVSLFVDSSLVTEENGQQFLQVTLVGDNGKPGFKSVLLPTESFETGSRWLSVPEHLLLQAA